jgi:threonine dehydrogenase-like Zn-dependent dehydrogenase
MAKMREAVLMGTKALEVREAEVPVPGDRVVVRVRNCGICGSDLHFYRGEIPAKDLRMGHEISGEIAQDVSGFSKGQPVAVEPSVVCQSCEFCLTGRYHLCPTRRFLGTMEPGAFAEYIAVPAYALHALPKNVDFEVGALVEPLAVTVHGLRQVGLTFGERVAVLGSGTIGLMAIVAARALGASDVFATARYPHQAEAARALGATVVDAGDESTQALTEALGGRAPEVVVETVGGHADTLQQAINVAASGGRVSILGLFTAPINVHLIMAILKEVSLIPGITYGRPGTRSDFEVAVGIAARHTEEMRGVITHRVPLGRIADGFAAASDKSRKSIKVTVEVSK